MSRNSRAITILAIATFLASRDPASAQSGEPGSLLVFPEYDNQCPTLITVTNVAELPTTGDISTRWVYVQSPGCSLVERTELLRATDTISVVTNVHRPGASRGFLYVYAIDITTQQAVSFNHLIGASMRFDCTGGSEYSIDPVAFRSPIAEHAPTDVDLDQARDLDGVEYAEVPDRILLPRFLGQSATLTSELILINLGGGLDSLSTVGLTVFNDNEDVFTAQQSFRCWDKVPLGMIGSMFGNAFLQGTANAPSEIFGDASQESGWISIDGMSVITGTTVAPDPATLAFLVETRNAGRAGSTPFGVGTQSTGSLPTAVQPPVCPDNVAFELWPPNHKYYRYDLATLAGVTDPQGLPVELSIRSITQDEPVDGAGEGLSKCDGSGVGRSIARIRAELSPSGNGRVYRIEYTARNSAGLSSSGLVKVTVPQDPAHPAVEDAAVFNSSNGCP